MDELKTPAAESTSNQADSNLNNSDAPADGGPVTTRAPLGAIISKRVVIPIQAKRAAKRTAPSTPDADETPDIQPAQAQIAPSPTALAPSPSSESLEAQTPSPAAASLTSFPDQTVSIAPAIEPARGSTATAMPHPSSDFAAPLAAQKSKSNRRIAIIALWGVALLVLAVAAYLIVSQLFPSIFSMTSGAK